MECTVWEFVKGTKLIFNTPRYHLSICLIICRELVKLSGSDCIVKLTNGDELQGCWRDGKRVGQGALYGPRLEKVS